MTTISQPTHAIANFVIAPLQSSNPTSVYKATEAQLEIWLSSQQSNEANCAYNEICSLDFKGRVDAQILNAAIKRVIDRNASLRSTFSVDGQDVIVHDCMPHSFTECDWSDRNDDGREKALQRVVENEGKTPFDLVKGPLIRFVLQRISDIHHRLTFTAHHLVMDGWSLAVFCRDLGHFYDLESGKTPPPLPSANQYDEYATAMSQYQTSEQRVADEAFWREMFEDAIPVLDLPIQSRRPALRTYRGQRHDRIFPAELVERFREITAKSSCSLYNGMLAAFSAYVSRISGSDDFTIGIPSAGQAAMQQPELIGHCVNTIPLRNRVDEGVGFVQHMTLTRTGLLNAFEHSRLSFGKLLRMLAPPRDPSRPPMVSVSFNVDPVINMSEMGFDGLDVSIRVEPRCFENFEWFVNGVIQKDLSIEMQVQSNADLFTGQAMEGYLEGFETFLTAIVDDPSRPIADYPTASLHQRQTMIVQWNQTEMETPVESTLHEQFSRQARVTPDRIAVQYGASTLTYAQVESRSNQVARFLRQRGVQPGDVVGICVERSEHMLVNLYAILKAGAGYVPLDPGYPKDRLRYMCDQSGLQFVLTQSSLKDLAAGFGKNSIVIDSNEDVISQLESTSLQTSVTASDICYVIYTSGSTGKPKGVQVPHGAVVNFLHSMRGEPGFAENDSLLAVTTLSFDIAVLELFLPTIVGGRVVVLDSTTAADGQQLIQQIDQHDISVLQATPATWRLLIQSGWNGKSDLKALCGGEPMPQDLVGPLLMRCGELWNMYGPTETTVWSSTFQITDENQPILIGKPIGNTQFYILDKNGKEVPIGCEGELHIGGAGVTLGYRNQPDLTDERFVKNPYRNPFASYVNDRLYKTGDVARYRHDGNVEFVRRNDKQVKVRGFRIELQEIEQNLKTYPGVQQAVVVVREDSPGDTRLAAYLVTKPGESVSQSDLRAHLRESLPPYMVPQHFVVLDQMPQTNNRKIDYTKLPKPSLDPSNETAATQEALKPTSQPEIYMATAWREVLEHDDIFVDDTFFDVGGHSLLVMQVIAKVHSETGIKLGPQDFLVNTLRQLARKIEDSDQFRHVTSNHVNATPAVLDSKNSVISSATNDVTDAEKGFWD